MPRLKHLMNSFCVQDSFCSTYSFYRNGHNLFSIYVETGNLREKMDLESFNSDTFLGPPESVRLSQHCLHVTVMGSCNLKAME